MTELNVGDLAIVTGPLEWCNNYEDLSSRSPAPTRLEHGEVVQIIQGIDDWGTVLVHGRGSGHTQFIQATSLTTWEDLCNDDSVEWGEIDLDGEIEISIPVYE